MVGKYQSWIAICFMLLFTNLQSSSADDIIFESSICVGGEDDNSRCALSCMLYPYYVSGYCNSDNKCICARRATVPPLTKPVPYGPCSIINGDSRCSLRCLFFKRFSGGYCNNGFCYCVPK